MLLLEVVSQLASSFFKINFKTFVTQTFFTAAEGAVYVGIPHIFLVVVVMLLLERFQLLFFMPCGVCFLGLFSLLYCECVCVEDSQI